jgi:hypothetical protein
VRTRNGCGKCQQGINANIVEKKPQTKKARELKTMHKNENERKLRLETDKKY